MCILSVMLGQEGGAKTSPSLSGFIHCCGVLRTLPCNRAGKDGGQEWKGLHLEVLDTNTWVGTGWDKAKDKIGSSWVLSTQGTGVSGSRADAHFPFLSPAWTANGHHISWKHAGESWSGSCVCHNSECSSTRYAAFCSATGCDGRSSEPTYFLGPGNLESAFGIHDFLSVDIEKKP